MAPEPNKIYEEDSANDPQVDAGAKGEDKAIDVPSPSLKTDEATVSTDGNSATFQEVVSLITDSLYHRHDNMRTLLCCRCSLWRKLLTITSCSLDHLVPSSPVFLPFALISFMMTNT